MRVALLHGGGDEAAAAQARRLGDALRAAGHEPVAVRAPALRPLDAALRARGFTGPLTPVAPALASLVAGRFDAAHAFSVPDALAALMWRRARGGRVVFTCVETLDRSSVADRRLRLALLRRALAEPDAILAGSEPARAALWTWMAVEVPVLAADDAAGHVRLYRA